MILDKRDCDVFNRRLVQRRVNIGIAKYLVKIKNRDVAFWAFVLEDVVFFECRGCASAMRWLSEFATSRFAACLTQTPGSNSSLRLV
jgi:hypothetical protein